MKLAALFLSITVAAALTSGCGAGAPSGNSAGADPRAAADATTTIPASIVDATASRPQNASDAAAVFPTAETAAASASPSGVPAPVQCYVDAVNQKNLDALVACFAANAVIIDVSRRIAGAEAIGRWADNEVIGGTLEVVEIAEQREGHVRLLVHWAPEGSSGWRAYYTFDYRDGRITQADLQYA